MPWAGPVTPTAPRSPDHRTPTHLHHAPPPAPLATRALRAGIRHARRERSARQPRDAAASRCCRSPSARPGCPCTRRLLAELAVAAGRGGYGPVAGTADAARGRGGLLDQARAADHARTPSSPGRAARRCCSALLLAHRHRRGGAAAELGELRRPGQADRRQRPEFVPAVTGEGGICDPGALDQRSCAAAAAGRRIGAVVVTMPDNPTGQAGQPGRCARAVRGGRAARPDHHLRRDLPRPGARPGGAVPEPGRWSRRSAPWSPPR